MTRLPGLGVGGAALAPAPAGGQEVLVLLGCGAHTGPWGLQKWDEDLAAFAKTYASKCVWGHNKDRGRRGENLFAITEGEMDLQLAVEQWYNEHEHYNLGNATCAEGQMCGHYTQVVWAKSERIGCGSHFCEKLEGVMETNVHVLVCNYEPPGNVKGQKPYKEGPQCSQCLEGYECKNQLCEPIIGPEEAGVSPSLATAAPTSMATETSPNLATEAPLSLATKTSTSLNEGIPPSPRLSIETSLKSLETEASKTKPDRVEPTQDGPQELPSSSSSSSSETQATTSLANNKLEEVPGTSTSGPPDLPQAGEANAMRGRTLALNSSLEDTENVIIWGRASSRLEFSLFGLLSCLLLSYFF
ncbi:peptidase inhibitor 16 [Gracilinanus agilis]|uniref:peptidase inhibitor 16 n=1 Tax=Gracilinanus agilis TaxID=191870 RepID=UPI001CFC9B72|nr:peptidase inhibitor 16 [Gracilinanus agilis]